MQIAIGNPQSKISFQIESGNQENRNLRDFISVSNIGVRVRVHCLQSAIENVKTCPERAKRVEWIENVVVPVVQRIEQGFPKVETAFLQQWSRVISNAQNAEFKRLEQLLRSSRVISNLPIFSPPGDTTGDTGQVR